jgi:hypothetical protein
MRRTIRWLMLGPALASLLLALPLSASAAPANNGTQDPSSAGWTTFLWDESGVSGPFVFTTQGTLYLEVTDTFCHGDQFSISDNGAEIGTTSSVPPDPDCDDPPYLETPIKSYREPSYSSGEFVLGPGQHSIVINEFTHLFPAGAGYFGAWENPAP